MKTSSKFNPYKVLGVKKDVGKQEVKDAYLRLAKQHHPDVRPGDAELFIRIKKAYDVLNDPDARQFYDRYGLVKGDEDSKHTLTAMANLQQGLKSILVQVQDPEHLKYFDVIESMEKSIIAREEALAKEAKAMREALKGRNQTILILKERLKTIGKETPNFFIEAIEREILEYPARIKQMELEKAMLVEMRRLLNDFEYEYEFNGGGFTMTMVV